MKVNRIHRIAIGGAFGGAINGFLCYTNLPIRLSNFDWHVVPAGSIHGAVLASLSVTAANYFVARPLAIRLIISLPLAWIAGFLSWIPLELSVFHSTWQKTLTWPFHPNWRTWYAPYWQFGLVTFVYYIVLSIAGSRQQNLAFYVLFAAMAGILGSFWFFVDHWYISLLHGVIWGCSVGVCAWIESRTTG